MASFLEALDERVLVCDGAMGTMLYGKGIFLNRCFDELNLTQPDLVAEIHQAYVRAGADVIETNTFGANRFKLGAFGLVERLHAVNVRGAQIARHAARDRAYVAGSIGPLGIRLEPFGKTGVSEAEDCFREQAVALLEGGVELFILETFRDVREIGAAMAAVQSLCDLPIVAQMTTQDDGNTLDGTPPEVFAPELERRGAHVLGVNCSVGPAAMLEAIDRMARATSARLSAQPNAGSPRDIEGRNIYLCSPEYMASYARRFTMNGVKLVGGCCGTTPEHIRAIKFAVRAPVASVRTAVVRTPEVASETPPGPPIARAQKSRMANAMARGAFIVAVELAPPRGDRRDELVAQAQTLKIHGVDVINIPDGLRSGVGRMSAWSAAILIEQQAGVEALLQYACRDRSLLRMQSDLLGAHAVGLRNLMIVTGEPARVGDYADVTSVLEVDSIGLTNVVAQLNRGLDIGGQAIARPTGFHAGVAASPGAIDLDHEVRRFEYKVEAGAEFAVTHPVFDRRAFERFLKRIEPFRIPIIVGIAPLESVRHADFLANEIPGVIVPDDLMARMRRCDSPEAAAAEGIAIARELAADLRSAAQGIQIAAPWGGVGQILAIMEVLAAGSDSRAASRN